MIKTAGIHDLVAIDLKRVEDRMREVVGDQNESLSAAIDCLVQAGGKRLRPTVTLLASRMRQADTTKAVSLAAGVEMLPTATLVHDDLIDNAVLRRGNPTLNPGWWPRATLRTGV